MPKRYRNLALDPAGPRLKRPEPRPGSRASQAGFTLVELITVMTIVGILMAVGVPSFRYVSNNSRVSAEVNSLVGDLQFARAQAIKEGLNVVACVSTDGATCNTSSPTTWQSGWIVFTDTNADGTVNTGDVVRRVQPQFTGTDTFVAPSALTAITFNREGYATGIPASTLIVLHDSTSSAKYTRCLYIGVTGQMSVLQNGQSAPLASGTLTCS